MGEVADDPLRVAATELAPGERLVWADRPAPSARRRRWLVPLFALALAGVAAFWTLQAGEAGSVAPFGLVFVAIGVLIAVRSFRRRARQTVYAVTDRRLLIIRDGRSRRVRSFQPADIASLERRERPDGSGDVIFGQETVIRDDLRLRRDGPPSHRVRRNEIGFFGVADVQRVEQAIRELRDRGAAG